MYQYYNFINISIIDSQYFEKPVRYDKGWVQTAARIKPHLEVRELTSKDELLSVFSSQSDDSRIVVTTRNGLKQSIVNKLFRRDEDLSSFREQFKDKIETFKFDQVFGIQTSDCLLNKASETDITKISENSTIKFIKLIKIIIVVNLFSNYLILYHFFLNTARINYIIHISLMLPRNSFKELMLHFQSMVHLGKSFSFSGNETNQKAILFQACDDIFNLQGSSQNSKSPRTHLSQKQQNIKVSIFSIYQDEIFDLLHTFQSKNIKQSIRELNEKSNVEVKIANITKKSINTTTEFKQVYSQAIQNLLLIGEEIKEQNYYGKSHIIVQFEVQTNIFDEGKDKNKIVKLSVVRVADTDIYENTQESARNDFLVLKKYLNHCSRYNEISQNYKIYKQSKFTFALRDTLNEESNIRLLCCVSTNPTAFITSLKTIEFFGRMTTGLDKTQLQQTQQSGQKRWISEDTGFYQQSFQNSPSFARKFKNSSFLNNDNTIEKHNPTHYNIQSQLQNEDMTTSKQIEMEQLIAETENLVTDLTKNEITISRLSLKERNLWLNEKQSQLRELVAQFDINSYNSPLNLVNYCDSLLQNANKLLIRIASPIRIRSKHGSMCSDSSDEEVQIIKEKIDRQINRLHDSDLDRSREIASCYASPLRLNSSFQKSTVQRISTLASPISRTYRNYSMTNIQNLPIQTEQRKQKVEQLLNNEQEKLATSLVNLKKSIRIKEDLEFQKRKQEDIEKRNLDIKLKDQTYRNQDLEELVKKKEQVIEQIDREMRNCQDDLVHNLEKIKEMETKQSTLTRTEQHLRDNNEALKQKILKKKKKIQIQKERAFLYLTLLYLQKVSKVKEHLRTQMKRSFILEFERFNQEIEHLRLQNQRLVQKCELELQEKFDIQAQTKEYYRQLEESEFQNQQFETRFQRMKSQLEQEIEDFKKQVEVLKKKKKQKMKKIKQYINEQDERIMQLENEIVQQDTQFKQTQVDTVDQKKEIEVLKETMKQATNEIVFTKQNSQSFQTETERLQGLVATLESKVKILENSAIEDAKVISQQKQQIEQEETQNVELRNQNKLFEVNVVSLEDKQNNEIGTIERQIDQLIIDITSSRALNEEYRIKEDGYRKQIISLSDLVEQYKEKYYKAKHKVKALKQQLKNMDEKFKSLEAQKVVEKNEIEKVKVNKKLQEQKENKLKVIDEIQGLIQTHKKVRKINN